MTPEHKCPNCSNINLTDDLKCTSCKREYVIETKTIETLKEKPTFCGLIKSPIFTSIDDLEQWEKTYKDAGGFEYGFECRSSELAPWFICTSIEQLRQGIHNDT